MFNKQFECHGRIQSKNQALIHFNAGGSSISIPLDAMQRVTDKSGSHSHWRKGLMFREGCDVLGGMQTTARRFCRGRTTQTTFGILGCGFMDAVLFVWDGWHANCWMR
jgi:hypothetical protein